MKKVRPVAVINSDALQCLPLRLVVPITGWKDTFDGKLSHVKLKPTKKNGLAKESAADTLQLRGIALERFKRKRGFLTAEEIEEITSAIAAVIEYI